MLFWIKCLLFAGALVAMSGQASAWGKIGHQAVAAIAERHLTPEAREKVAAILATEGKKSLVQVALWADRVKRLTVPVQPSHGVWIPSDAEAYDPKRDCPKNRCIVAAIDADTQALSDPKVSVEAKMAALKYLVHFVGDIHQPLHALKVKSLHKTWDTHIISHQQANWKELAHRVDAEEKAPKELASAADWAWESHQLARQIVRDAKRLRQDDGSYALDADYFDANWPIVERRLKAAGMRLAWTLNDVFGPGKEVNTSGSLEPSEQSD